MKRTFLRVWKSPSIMELMFLVKTKNGHTFILTPFSYLPIEEEIESVETVTMACEGQLEEIDEDDYEEE